MHDPGGLAPIWTGLVIGNVVYLGFAALTLFDRYANNSRGLRRLAQLHLQLGIWRYMSWARKNPDNWVKDMQWSYLATLKAGAMMLVLLDILWLVALLAS
jgi:hypothetical protein